MELDSESFVQTKSKTPYGYWFDNRDTKWDWGNKYSDTLANGDRKDDLETEFEHDPNDPIVDFNGHTNAGYAHVPYNDPNHFYKFDEAHYADNNIKNLFPEHFGTVPRADFVQTKVKKSTK